MGCGLVVKSASLGYLHCPSNDQFPNTAISHHSQCFVNGIQNDVVCAVLFQKKHKRYVANL